MGHCPLWVGQIEEACISGSRSHFVVEFEPVSKDVSVGDRDKLVQANFVEIRNSSLYSGLVELKSE